jgi:hypothetical protein
MNRRFVQAYSSESDQASSFEQNLGEDVKLLYNAYVRLEERNHRSRGERDE